MQSTPTSAFKPPRFARDVTNQQQPLILPSQSSSTSSTEEYMYEEGMDTGIESCIKEEVQLWLASHGCKLFALETSKFLAAESKRKTVPGKR